MIRRVVLLWIMLGVTVTAQTISLRGTGTPANPSSSVLSQSDITYVSAIRMPTSGVDTTFAYGGLAGRQVSGETHLFVYGRSNSGCTNTGIASGTSTTVFTVDSGRGADFSVSEVVNVWRGTNTPEERTITNISTDTITVTPALGGTPTAGDAMFEDDCSGVYELVDPAATSCGSQSYNTAYTSAPRACLYKAWGNVYHGHRASWYDDGTQQTIAGVLPQGLYWEPNTSTLHWCYEQQYVEGSYYPCGFSTLDNVSTGASTGYGPFKFLATDGDSRSLKGSQVAGYLQAKPDGSALVEGLWYQIEGWPAGPNLKAATSCSSCSSGWPTTSTPSGYGHTVTYSTRYLYYYDMNEGNASGNYWNADGTLHGTIRDFYTTLSSGAYVFEPNYESPRIDDDPSVNGNKYAFTELDSNGGCYWFSGTFKSGVICVGGRVGGPSGNSSDCTTGAHHYYETCAPEAPGCTPNQDPINHINCSHGCSPAIVTTGPQANHFYAGMAIFDPADADAVAAGTKTDYTVQPSTYINLNDTYGIHTAGEDGTLNGGSSNIKMGYFDSTRNYLFLVSTLADDSNPGVNTTLLYVFHIDDSAPPAPRPVFPAALYALTAMVTGWTLLKKSWM